MDNGNILDHSDFFTSKGQKNVVGVCVGGVGGFIQDNKRVERNKLRTHYPKSKLSHFGMFKLTGKHIHNSVS